MAGSLTENLRLLADETRLRMLHLLHSEPLTVAELQEIIDVSQSSVSGHLAKLKRAGFLHDHAEGSSHRYRLREDMPAAAQASWQAVRDISQQEPLILSDATRLSDLRRQRGKSWIERVAGTLHREYAPGRSFEALFHGFAHCLELGVSIDVGAGDGALLEILAPRCRELICIDPASSMVQAGEQRCKELGLKHVRYLEAGAENLPLDDASADNIFFIQSLQYVPNPAAAISQCLRVLKPGGRLVIMTLAAHKFPEAERYGHQHRGFSAKQLTNWMSDFDEVAVTPLAAETRAPRFQPLIATARKPQ